MSKEVHLVIACFASTKDEYYLEKIKYWLKNIASEKWGDPSSVTYIGCNSYSFIVKEWCDDILFCNFQIKELNVSSPRTFLSMLKKLSPRNMNREKDQKNRISTKLMIDKLAQDSTHVLIFDEDGSAIDLYKLISSKINNVIMISLKSE